MNTDILYGHCAAQCFYKLDWRFAISFLSNSLHFLKLHSVVSDNDFLPAVSLIRKNTPYFSVSVLLSDRLFESMCIPSLMPSNPCLNLCLILNIQFLHDLFHRHACQSHFYSLLFHFNRITHSCPHRKTPPSLISANNHPFSNLKVFCLSHLMGSVPIVRRLFMRLSF